MSFFELLVKYFGKACSNQGQIFIFLLEVEKYLGDVSATVDILFQFRPIGW